MGSIFYLSTTGARKKFAITKISTKATQRSVTASGEQEPASLAAQ